MEEKTTVSDAANRLAWLSLKLVPELGNRGILRLVDHFGSPAAVLEASARELSDFRGLKEAARTALLARAFTHPPAQEMEKIRRAGARILTMLDPDYPSNLRVIPDPPAVLFVKGSIEPRDLVAVAVVGSRAASTPGMAFTEGLCRDLAYGGVTVVSGLAVGIDSAAHRGALKARGRTLAVMGCGLDVDYPRSNAALREEIALSGALLTEFVLGTPPAPGHFPQRNRIISGLALGVVVVEAAHRSGSLITARLALEQGREVFAVPGMARHFRSIGPHRLLKEGAKLVESAEDILEEIAPLVRRSPESVSRERSDVPAQPLNEDESALWKVMGESPKHIDEISRDLRWPVSRVTSHLLAMELKGIVRQLPGKYFMREAKRGNLNG